MLQGLLALGALAVVAGVSPIGPALALESGETCDIEDDAVQPDTLKDLERILKELRSQQS